VNNYLINRYLKGTKKEKGRKRREKELRDIPD
jgi:hypothetical protein